MKGFRVGMEKFANFPIRDGAKVFPWCADCAPCGCAPVKKLGIELTVVDIRVEERDVGAVRVVRCLVCGEAWYAWPRPLPIGGSGPAIERRSDPVRRIGRLA